PNVELRRNPAGAPYVVLSFPYDPELVAFVRTIPLRRFDWETREWWAPAGDWAGMKVAELLERAPDLTADDHVTEWLGQIKRRRRPPPARGLLGARLRRRLRKPPGLGGRRRRAARPVAGRGARRLRRAARGPARRSGRGRTGPPAR